MDKDYFFKRLAFKQPTALEAYNYDFLPDKFLAHDKIPIECKTHGIFHQKVHGHLNGLGCPVCGELKQRNSRALSTEEFVANSKNKFGDRFRYEKTIYTRQNIELALTCVVHGDIHLKPTAHYQYKFGCPHCSVEIPFEIKKRKVLDQARKIHGNKYDYSKVVYLANTKPVEIVCLKHGSFWQTLDAHVRVAQGCPSCATENDRLTLDDFIAKARKIHGYRYDYSKVKYETTLSKVTITCPRHGDWVQRAGSHLLGNKCKECSLEENRLTTEEFIRNAKAVHGETFDYSRVVYRGNKKPVEVICSVHGPFWIKPNSHVSSMNGCRFCYESKGEKTIEVVLKKYGIDHIREHRVLPYLFRFDFYLPKFNVFIEFNGLQHYQPVDLFGGIKAFQQTKERDMIKRDIVAKIGGRLIILSYVHRFRGTIEKALIRELKKEIPELEHSLLKK